MYREPHDDFGDWGAWFWVHGERPFVWLAWIGREGTYASWWSYVVLPQPDAWEDMRQGVREITEKVAANILNSVVLPQ